MVTGQRREGTQYLLKEFIAHLLIDLPALGGNGEGDVALPLMRVVSAGGRLVIT